MNVMEEVLLKFGGSDITNVVISGTAYFVAKDVTATLGYSNSRDAIKKHVCEEDKIKKTIFYKGQNRKVTLVNDLGVLDLVSRSRLESAKQFKKWLVREVLPSIFKYGMYLTPEARKLKEEAPNEFESAYLNMKRDLEESEKARERLEKVAQDALAEVSRVNTVNAHLKADNEEITKRSEFIDGQNANISNKHINLLKERVEATEELNHLSGLLRDTTKRWMEANKQVLELESDVERSEKVLKDVLPVTQFGMLMSQILPLRGDVETVVGIINGDKGNHTNRNIVYEILREKGIVKKELNYNIVTEYGVANGYAENVWVEVKSESKREYVQRYSKPHLTPKGVVAVYEALVERGLYKPKNIFA